MSISHILQKAATSLSHINGKPKANVSHILGTSAGFAAAGGVFPTVPNLWARYKASTHIGLGDAARPSQWDDISGNARHAVQATSGVRPTLRTAAAGLTGNTCAFDFTPSASFWNVPSMSALSNVFIFLVVKNDTHYTSSTNGGAGLHYMGTASAYTYFNNFTASIGEVAGRNGSAANVSSYTGVTTTWQTYMMFVPNGSSSYWKNNASIGTGTTQGSYPGAPKIGRGFDSSNYYNGRIAEYFISTSDPGSTVRADLQTYAVAEYGI